MTVDLSGPLMSAFSKAKKEFEDAVRKGDIENAKKKALECSRILRQLSKYDEFNRNSYLKKAEKWERIANDVKIKVVTTETKIDAKETKSDEDKDFRSYVEELISKSNVKWSDIGGLEEVKKLMMETVVISALKKPKSIQPWKGILLFGPPGTGKTLLASAAAGSLKATFFNVKTSTVLSKYFGESSKMISTLYSVAREKAPSIVFIDEIDALTMKRSQDLSEASRRVLSTLLAEFDGFQDKKNDTLVLTLAATNTPWDLDEAILSRFPRRIYVPLPDKKACIEIIKINIGDLDTSKLDLLAIAEECVKKFYSGRDLKILCQEAIWNMIREENPKLYELAELPFEELKNRTLKIRPLETRDFEEALKRVKSPLSKKDIEKYEKWVEEYGEYQ